MEVFLSSQQGPLSRRALRGRERGCVQQMTVCRRIARHCSTRYVPLHLAMYIKL